MNYSTITSPDYLKVFVSSPPAEWSKPESIKFNIDLGSIADANSKFEDLSASATVSNWSTSPQREVLIYANKHSKRVKKFKLKPAKKVSWGFRNLWICRSLTTTATTYTQHPHLVFHRIIEDCGTPARRLVKQWTGCSRITLTLRNNRLIGYVV